jgi:hypothetical protein
VLGAPGLLTTTAACTSESCIDLACSSFFQLTVTDAVPALGARTAASARFCVANEICQTYRLTRGATGWTCEASTTPADSATENQSCSFEGGSLRLSMGTSSGPYRDNGTHTLSFAVSDASAAILSKTGPIEVSRRNPGCSRVCNWGQASVSAA